MVKSRPQLYKSPEQSHTGTSVGTGDGGTTVGCTMGNGVLAGISVDAGARVLTSAGITVGKETGVDVWVGNCTEVAVLMSVGTLVSVGRVVSINVGGSVLVVVGRGAGLDAPNNRQVRIHAVSTLQSTAIATFLFRVVFFVISLLRIQRLKFNE